MTTAANAGVVVVKDETVVEARAAIETALNVEKSARSRLELVQSRYQRTERTLTYARRMMTRAVDRGKWASSELDVSRRGVAEYRGGLKGEERWEAESRKWGEQSQSVGRELDRWSAELRRIDVESHRSEGQVRSPRIWAVDALRRTCQGNGEQGATKEVRRRPKGPRTPGAEGKMLAARIWSATGIWFRTRV